MKKIANFSVVLLFLCPWRLWWENEDVLNLWHKFTMKNHFWTRARTHTRTESSLLCGQSFRSHVLNHLEVSAFAPTRLWACSSEQALWVRVRAPSNKFFYFGISSLLSVPVVQSSSQQSLDISPSARNKHMMSPCTPLIQFADELAL